MMVKALRQRSEFTGVPFIERPSFDEWLGRPIQQKQNTFTSKVVQHRFHRNGFDWDIRGTLFEPKQSFGNKIGFVMLHGGAGSEMEMVETPDGRPGLAPLLAREGFRVLAISYPGHLPLEGWSVDVADRNPCYLFDRELSADEVCERNVYCTYNTIIQGAAGLIDEHMTGYALVAFGHSTGGPMAVSLQSQVRKAQVAGIVGWGSGGPDGWYLEWMKATQARSAHATPVGTLSKRTIASFREAGYEDDADLTPWGRAEDYFAWAFAKKAQFKTCLCDNQHGGTLDQLLKYREITNLPPLELVDHLFDPDPNFLKKISVLLLVGENDRLHWGLGASDDERLETYMAQKFAMRTVRTSLIIIPRLGHFGYVGRDHQLIAAAWVDAIKAGFFPALTERLDHANTLLVGGKNN